MILNLKAILLTVDLSINCVDYSLKYTLYTLYKLLYTYNILCYNMLSAVMLAILSKCLLRLRSKLPEQCNVKQYLISLMRYICNCEVYSSKYVTNLY